VHDALHPTGRQDGLGAVVRIALDDLIQLGLQEVPLLDLLGLAPGLEDLILLGEYFENRLDLIEELFSEL
jgi:hypothetical protein